MSHKSSGLWCDLCGKPILSGEWWHIRVQGKQGHACGKCQQEYQKRFDLYDGKILPTSEENSEEDE